MDDHDRQERSAESRLREYFDEAERAAGVRSVQGSQIDRRAGHLGAAENPDGWCPRGWNPARSAITRRCREVRAALLTLTPRQRDVLAAVYATDAATWQAHADRAFAAGTGIELVRRFGDLVGVALLLAPAPVATAAPLASSSPPPPLVEDDAALRTRLAASAEWGAARAYWGLPAPLDHFARGELDLAAAWLGEAPRQVRLPVWRPRLQRTDGAGAWLVRLAGREAVAEHLAAARAAHAEALAAFCRAADLQPAREKAKARKPRVYRWEASTIAKVRVLP